MTVKNCIWWGEQPVPLCGDPREPACGKDIPPGCPHSSDGWEASRPYPIKVLQSSGVGLKFLLFKGKLKS